MDFSNGKIYRIRSAHSELPYIGSTVDSLEERFDEHQRWYKKWINSGKQRTSGMYCSSAEILKYPDSKIELVENYPCNSKEELREYEGSFQNPGVNCVNLKKAGRAFAEWHKTVYYPKNKEKLLKQQKAPHIKAYRKERILCECGTLYRRSDKQNHIKRAIHKLFFTNPEEHAKKMKAKEERDKVPKYECGCGSKINISQTTGAINRHKKKKKHQEWLKSQKKQTLNDVTPATTMVKELKRA